MLIKLPYGDSTRKVYLLLKTPSGQGDDDVVFPAAATYEEVSDKISKEEYLEGRLMVLEEYYREQMKGCSSYKRQVSAELKRLEVELGLCKQRHEVAVSSTNEACGVAVVQIRQSIPTLQRILDIYDDLVKKHFNRRPVKAFIEVNEGMFQKIKEVVSAVAALPSKPTTSDDCQQTQRLHAQVLEFVLSLKDSGLTNLYEDASGAVRVYVRIRPSKQAESNDGGVRKLGQSVVIPACGTQASQQKYGRFFSVFPREFNNTDVYFGCSVEGLSLEQRSCCYGSGGDLKGDSSGICRVMEQLRDGYHVMLFGYGYSGSGKTHSLLGNGVEAGMTQLAISASKADSVRLTGIVELTYKTLSFTEKGGNVGKVIRLFQSRDSQLSGLDVKLKQNKVAFVNEENEFSHFWTKSTGREFPSDGLTHEVISELASVINLFRTKKGRVKATPNNPESSRSHLFMFFDFTYQNRARTGRLTIADLAGQERSEEILEMFLRKPPDKKWQVPSLMMVPPLYPSYLKSHVFTKDDPLVSSVEELLGPTKFAGFLEDLNATAKDLDKIVEVLKESIYINETLNQLVAFLLKGRKENVNIGMNKDLSGRGQYSPDKFFTHFPWTSDSMGMYTLLQHVLPSFDEAAQDDFPPVKLVMMCHVREEVVPDVLCQSARKTLEFAEKIRST